MTRALGTQTQADALVSPGCTPDPRFRGAKAQGKAGDAASLPALSLYIGCVSGLMWEKQRERAREKEGEISEDLWRWERASTLLSTPHSVEGISGRLSERTDVGKETKGNEEIHLELGRHTWKLASAPEAEVLILCGFQPLRRIQGIHLRAEGEDPSHLNIHRQSDSGAHPFKVIIIGSRQSVQPSFL